MAFPQDAPECFLIVELIKYSEALECYLRAVSIRERELGKDDLFGLAHDCELLPWGGTLT